MMKLCFFNCITISSDHSVFFCFKFKKLNDKVKSIIGSNILISSKQSLLKSVLRGFFFTRESDKTKWLPEERQAITQ
jgi:hypothetical protein